MATTLEKVEALVAHLRTVAPGDMSNEGQQLAESYQIMVGLGFDPLPMLMPDSDAEADVLIDNLIALLLQLRGDDLPPFDLNRYGEADEEEPAERAPGEDVEEAAAPSDA